MASQYGQIPLSAITDEAIVNYQNRLMKEQDRHLDDIERSVGTLHEASVVMNQEITLQNRLLEGLSDDVSRTQGAVASNRSRLDWFRNNRGTCKIWLVIIIAFSLFILIASKY